MRPLRPTTTSRLGAALILAFGAAVATAAAACRADAPPPADPLGDPRADPGRAGDPWRDARDRDRDRALASTTPARPPAERGPRERPAEPAAEAPDADARDDADAPRRDVALAAPLEGPIDAADPPTPYDLRFTDEGPTPPPGQTALDNLGFVEGPDGRVRRPDDGADAGAARAAGGGTTIVIVTTPAPAGPPAILGGPIDEGIVTGVPAPLPSAGATVGAPGPAAAPAAVPGTREAPGVPPVPGMPRNAGSPRFPGVSAPGLPGRTWQPETR